MTPPYRASRIRLMCKDCRHQSTVTAGTIFDKTRTPLRVWLAAAWYLTNQKQGVSASGLQRVLGLGSYQTAWTMLHRFRRAMVRTGRERLKGLVEIDEAYIAITDRENPISAVGRKSHTHKVMIGLAVEILAAERLRAHPACGGYRATPRNACGSSFKTVSNRARSCEPMAQEAMPSCTKSAMTTSVTSCTDQVFPLTSRWPACIVSPLFSSAGSSGHITDRFSRSTWTHISTSSYSASIAALRRPAACSSIVYFSNPWSPIR